jgi:uncharacterized LabA/DUF88 family protein
MPSERVAVFIDNSNVFHNLHNLAKVDPNWTRLYDPLVLARRLAGKRECVYVGFYCARPPAYMLTENTEAARKHATAMRYYSAVEKLPGVTVKYATLQGAKGSIQEKNLDTQVATDLVTKAALNEYDVAIIVSNDGDFVGPVEAVKSTFGKRVEVAFFKGSLSMNLKRVCDLSRRMRRVDFARLRC